MAVWLRALRRAARTLSLMNKPKPVPDVPSEAQCKQTLAECPITMDRWGRDHWSTLAFIETLCVDHGGQLNDRFRRNLRVNERTHPGHGYWESDMRWKPEYGTRLKGYAKDHKLQLPDHDDWDCAEDMEAAGLLLNLGTGINPIWKLTERGLDIAAMLRAHKANGGSFSTFML